MASVDSSSYFTRLPQSPETDTSCTSREVTTDTATPQQGHSSSRSPPIVLSPQTTGLLLRFYPPVCLCVCLSLLQCFLCPSTSHAPSFPPSSSSYRSFPPSPHINLPRSVHTTYLAPIPRSDPFSASCGPHPDLVESSQTLLSTTSHTSLSWDLTELSLRNQDICLLTTQTSPVPSYSSANHSKNLVSANREENAISSVGDHGSLLLFNPVLFLLMLYVIVELWLFLRFRRLRHWLKAVPSHRSQADPHFIEAVASLWLINQTASDMYKFLQYSFFAGYKPENICRDYLAEWLRKHVQCSPERSYAILSIIEQRAGVTFRSCSPVPSTSCSLASSPSVSICRNLVTPFSASNTTLSIDDSTVRHIAQADAVPAALPVACPPIRQSVVSMCKPHLHSPQTSIALPQHHPPPPSSVLTSTNHRLPSPVLTAQPLSMLSSRAHREQHTTASLPTSTPHRGIRGGSTSCLGKPSLPPSCVLVESVEEGGGEGGQQAAASRSSSRLVGGKTRRSRSSHSNSSTDMSTGTSVTESDPESNLFAHASIYSTCLSTFFPVPSSTASSPALLSLSHRDGFDTAATGESDKQLTAAGVNDAASTDAGSSPLADRQSPCDGLHTPTPPRPPPYPRLGTSCHHETKRTHQHLPTPLATSAPPVSYTCSASSHTPPSLPLSCTPRAITASPVDSAVSKLSCPETSSCAVIPPLSADSDQPSDTTTADPHNSIPREAWTYGSAPIHPHYRPLIFVVALYLARYLVSLALTAVLSFKQFDTQDVTGHSNRTSTRGCVRTPTRKSTPSLEIQRRGNVGDNRWDRRCLTFYVWEHPDKLQPTTAGGGSGPPALLLIHGFGFGILPYVAHVVWLWARQRFFTPVTDRRMIIVAEFSWLGLIPLGDLFKPCSEYQQEPASNSHLASPPSSKPFLLRACANSSAVTTHDAPNLPYLPTMPEICHEIVLLLSRLTPPDTSSSSPHKQDQLPNNEQPFSCPRVSSKSESASCESFNVISPSEPISDFEPNSEVCDYDTCTYAAGTAFVPPSSHPTVDRLSARGKDKRSGATGCSINGCCHGHPLYSVTGPVLHEEQVLPFRVDVVAHSYGTAICSCLHQMYPQLLRKCVLFDPICFFPQISKKAQLVHKRPWEVRLMDRPYRKNSVCGLVQSYVDRFTLCAYWYLVYRDFGTRLTTSRQLQGHEYLDRGDLTAMKSRLLVVMGTHDLIVPCEALQRYVDGCEDVNYIVVNGAHHGISLFCFRVLKQVSLFLRL
eukprot:GHVQ01029031.1.p1 GENE.GHVQ01029031.1~~GHVQ01029031.1.p1  ORF type:complete len:1251 (+),score=174.67 GHVQ01029031.1:379-4131(+)